MRIPRMTTRVSAFGASVALWEAIAAAVVAVLLGRYAFSIAMGRMELSGEDFIGEVAT